MISHHGQFLSLLVISCCLFAITHGIAEDNIESELKPPPKSAKKPPRIPPGFSFKAEVVQPASEKLPLNLLRTAEQWYFSVYFISTVYNDEASNEEKVARDL